MLDSPSFQSKELIINIIIATWSYYSPVAVGASTVTKLLSAITCGRIRLINVIYDLTVVSTNSIFPHFPQCTQQQQQQLKYM